MEPKPRGSVEPWEGRGCRARGDPRHGDLRGCARRRPPGGWVGARLDWVAGLDFGWGPSGPARSRRRVATLRRSPEDTPRHPARWRPRGICRAVGWNARPQRARRRPRARPGRGPAPPRAEAGSGAATAATDPSGRGVFPSG